MYRLFNNRNYGVAVVALSGYALFHLDSWTAVFVGAPAVYFGLHILFAKTPADRKLEKFIDDLSAAITPQLTRLANIASRLDKQTRP